MKEQLEDEMLSLPGFREIEHIKRIEQCKNEAGFNHITIGLFLRNKEKASDVCH